MDAMRFFKPPTVWFLLLIAVGGPASLSARDTPRDRLDFKEVFELLQTQLPDVDEAALHDAAARGLIEQLGPRVRLLSPQGKTEGQNASNAVVKVQVLEDGYGYLRLGQINPGALAPFESAITNLAASNQLNGLILDLRLADGADYSEAKQIADLFFATERPLIDWGQGPEKSRAKTNALNWPVAVLVNRQTAGAAEALAGMLRYGGVGLLIGARTAGQASMYKEIPLRTGQRLLIATTPVKVAENNTLSPEGLAPDIVLKVNPDREREWLSDPYKPLLSGAGSARSANEGDEDLNAGAGVRTPRHHLNEADLVRMLRDGEMIDQEPAGLSRETGPAKPVVRDPVLARALDFLKGLAVVRKFQPR
jgi:Peptidase family S41